MEVIDKKTIIVSIILVISCMVYSVFYILGFNKIFISKTRELKEEVIQLKDECGGNVVPYEKSEKRIEKAVEEEVQKNSEGIEYCSTVYPTSYFEENSKYYMIENGKKVQIISKEKATKIALKEAQKAKYTLKEWNSEKREWEKGRKFKVSKNYKEDYYYSVSIYTNNQEPGSEEWRTGKYKEGQILWQVQLPEEKEEYTTIMIYIDVKNGNVVGASLSDHTPC